RLDFAGAAAELSCAAGAPFEPLSGLDESSPAGGVWLPLVGTDSVVGSGSPGGDSGSSVGSLVGGSDGGLSVVVDGGSRVGGGGPGRAGRCRGRLVAARRNRRCGGFRVPGRGLRVIGRLARRSVRRRAFRGARRGLARGR